jgi:transcription antitermination factor NusG
MQTTKTYETSNCSEAQIGVDWYALYTKHRHEKVIARNLTYKGFESFVPLYEAARNWKDRVKQIDMPLFPCYVFFRGDLERRLEIAKIPGIFSLVSNGGRPNPILASEIDNIRRAAGSGARLEPHPFLSCGDRVRVKCGPLAGIEGILVRKKSVYRLVLTVEMLGKAAALEVDAVLIERLNNNKPAQKFGGRFDGYIEDNSNVRTASA